MAEVVEFQTEESIPELEATLKLLFNKEQAETLINLRKEHEYIMQRSNKSLEDCTRYINFEIKFLRAVEIYQKKKNLTRNSQIANLEFAIINRLITVITQTVRSYPEDLKTWLLYIKFCKQMHYTSNGSRVWKQMLEIHGSSWPELYKQAAQWEVEECNCVEKARKHLMTGIHVHKDSKLLLKEAFRLELFEADRKRKECLEKNLPIDSQNPHLTAQKAETIYDCSIKRLKDVELLYELLNICADYDFTSVLADKIYNDLIQNDNDERMWDIIAKRDFTLQSGEGKPSIKDRIGKCVALYETAVKRLNTERMWAYYLDALQDLEKDSAELPNHKCDLILSALNKGAIAGKLTENHYLIWVSKLQEPEKHKELVSMLQGAVKRLPESDKLWHTLLRVHLIKEEEKQAGQVFEEGVATLGAKSLPLWKLMLQCAQLNSKKKVVERIYKKSFKQCAEVSGILMPEYLQWLVLTKDIVAARKAYDTMCDTSPNCLQMHKMMIHLETIQPTMDLNRIRLCHTIACDVFGYSNVEVWLDHCKFEEKSGDPRRVNQIYWRARKNLDPNLFETFLAEFSLFGTIPPTNKLALIKKVIRISVYLFIIVIYFIYL